MSVAGVTVFPWAEYMVTNRNSGTSTGQSQKILSSAGIDMDNVLHLSPETEELKHILDSHQTGYILRVHTIEDLNDLTVLLFGKPLLMRINLVHTEVSSKYSADKISIWEGDFACVLNASHRQVRSQMEWALKQAENHLDKGDKFSIEIELGDVVEGWYLQSLDLFSGCDDFHSTKTRNSRLILTNHTPFNHCFDCRPKWWLCLGPCWLVTAPVYYFKDVLVGVLHPANIYCDTGLPVSRSYHKGT
ncbi:uncharacterized protein LOC125680314 isoform X2 [Ostrea edulis]|uniref:uncharacterized protein LOC125680314 isoform X2 n=1 Tax=Ostrea edulis TaxID=37623 RepID=UPI0024AF400A|nr:uncharacterized protein LOC125680314 isoform X2 [Ostrea edulis]